MINDAVPGRTPCLPGKNVSAPDYFHPGAGYGQEGFRPEAGPVVNLILVAGKEGDQERQ